MKTDHTILSGFAALFLITASVSVGSANTLYVSPETGAGNYTSIQEALEHAHNGDKILVYPGNYTENVVVNLTNICIISASEKPGDTIVQAKNVKDSVFYVHADDVKIGGLTIQGSERAGIELDSSNGHIILSNRISRNPTGILLNFSGGNTIYRNSIEENLEGITMLDSNNSMVTENVINTNNIAVAIALSENNFFSKNTLKDNPSGFILQESENNEVAGNTISDSREAFTLDLSRRNSFFNNKLTNTSVGFMLEGSKENEVDGNTILTCEIPVMMNSSSDNCFSSNTLKNASIWFMLEQSENNKVSENTIDTSAIAVMVNSSRTNHFSENLLTNNSFGFLALQQSENNEFMSNLLDSSMIGVFLSFSGNNSFSENTFTNTGYGFILQDSDNNDFMGNTIDFSEISLALDSGRDNEISGNKFSNTLIGTLLEGSDNSTLSRNEFSNNLLGVLALEANKNTIVNNNFSSNLTDSFSASPLDYLYSLSSNKSTLLKENRLFGKNGFIKKNEPPKEDSFLGANSFIEQKGLFKENELPAKVFSAQGKLLENSELFGIEGLFEENGTFGIFLQDVNNSVLEGNRISDIYYGVVLSGAQNSRLSGNQLENNEFGLVLNESNGSLVYNNYLNNTNNAAFGIEEIFGLEGAGNENNQTCTWNLSKTKGTNVVGGPYIGGNYWALPNGTGFSQTQKDINKDGICDLPYNITEDELNIDILPLAGVPETKDNCEGSGKGSSYGSSSSEKSIGSGSTEGSYGNGSSGNSYGSSSTEDSYGSGSSKYFPDSSKSAEEADSVQKNIFAGTESNVVFYNPKYDISGVCFKSMKYSGIVGIRVEEADINKTNSITEPDCKTYRYFKILVGNEVFESSENIAGGSIDLRVPKNWVEENGINPGTISLNRLEENGWKLLETELTGENGDFYYFRAKTPGFSIYSITGKQQGLITSSEHQGVIASSEQKAEKSAEVAGSDAAKGKAATGENKKAPGFGIILSGAGGLLARACFKRR
jgi:PGF-pre-PGF domain-containing protein